MSSSVVPSPVLWLEGEIKDCFPILHIGLVPQGWIQSNVDSIKTLLREVRCDSLWCKDAWSASLFQIWGGFVQIPSLRACPNVETNAEGFPYSGNCSMLCGVDVYPPFAGLSLWSGRAWARPLGTSTTPVYCTRQGQVEQQ